jgi:putative transposase
METELAANVGPKHAKQPGRLPARHGSADDSVVLGGRRVPVSRPRARTIDGREVTPRHLHRLRR